jgi:hypothetical protein
MPPPFHRREEPLRLLDPREVPTLLEDHDLGVPDPVGDPVRLGRRREHVEPARRDPYRAGDRAEAVDRAPPGEHLEPSPIAEAETIVPANSSATAAGSELGR